MIDYTSLKERYKSLYHGEPRIFRAPGRVNLIGEHTDYNGGFVLPMAIDLETAVAIRERSDRKFRVFSVNYDEMAEFDIDLPYEERPGHWISFIEGVARILHDRGAISSGADLVIWSDIPAGAGLSSSAALEIAVGLGLTELAGNGVERVTLAEVGQQTEHEYVGAKVGIMDQFVSAHARAGHALLLDCRTLGYEHVPIDTSKTAVVVCDTHVKHDLAASEYNMRRAECNLAVKALRAELPKIKDLRDVTPAELEEFGSRLPGKIRKRANHVVRENERTILAADSLRAGDLAALGELMKESHRSLRDDYEVSSRELDILVDLALEVEGVLGSRMTGGGFGGSTVSLVPRDRLGEFREHITNGYHDATGIMASILVAVPSDGASEVGNGKKPAAPNGTLPANISAI